MRNTKSGTERRTKRSGVARCAAIVSANRAFLLAALLRTMRTRIELERPAGNLGLIAVTALEAVCHGCHGATL